MSGFHGAFATGVASQQGTLTLPDTWFRPPFWDLLMLQLLRPNSSNLPCLYSTFHLEYPLVLSRFYFNNLHVKSERDWAKTIVCIVSTMYYTQCQKWPWPMTPWPKINRVPPLIIHNLHGKSESDVAKTIVCIVPTRSYTQSAKDDLDLWPHDPKSIGLLLLSSTNYMWSLKVIGL